MKNQNIVRRGKIVPKGSYGNITLDAFNAILDIKTDGRHAIKGIINLLYDDSIDHEEVIGAERYKYIIRCSQNKLAKLTGMTISHFSNGIKQLIEAKLVVKEDGLFYINPLVFNANQIIDKRTLNKFGIKYNK